MKINMNEKTFLGMVENVKTFLDYEIKCDCNVLDMVKYIFVNDDINIFGDGIISLKIISNEILRKWDFVFMVLYYNEDDDIECVKICDCEYDLLNSDLSHNLLLNMIVKYGMGVMENGNE